jgi:hypothetical protein
MVGPIDHLRTPPFLAKHILTHLGFTLKRPRRVYGFVYGTPQDFLVENYWDITHLQTYPSAPQGG